MPLRNDLKKVMVIGSGPIIIGQAAEFDYAGTQACRALKEEGLEVVLVNSNPATIMTDKAMADKVYIEPLTLDVVKRIIEIEKPDGLLSTLGGQTGLTLSMQLDKDGFLAEHNVRLLGAKRSTIDKAEDKGLVNIKDYLTGLDGFDIVYDRNDDYPQIKADDMARLWEIVNNDETLRVLAPVDWN